MKYLFTAVLLLLAGCADIDPKVIDALGKDQASNCFGAVGYGVGVYGGRANDPTISVEIGPTGCKISHTIAPGNAPIIITGNPGQVRVIKPSEQQ